MHRSLCVDCGHEKIMHTDLEKPDKMGECCAMNGHCQCAQFVRSEAEGSDIVDVGSQEDRGRLAFIDESGLSNVGVYDASLDTIVTPDAGESKERILVNETEQAEETIQKATSILDGNTETLSPEQADLRRISINSMRPGTEVHNGDLWKPSPSELYIFHNGQWFTPDEYRVILAAEKEKGVEDDPVNHPSHYTAYPEIEVIQLTRWMSFNLGNAVKYIARAGLKDSDKEIQDLEKAIWYIKDEIARKKGEYGTMQE